MVMAKPCLLALLLLLHVACLPVTIGRSSPAHHKPKPNPRPTPPPPPPPSLQVTALMRTTCNSTTYYDVCVAALAADPSSSTADVRGLSAIAVSAAATNATAAASAAAALANATAPTSNDPAVRALLRTCAARYGDARDALRAAGDSISEENYDYASVHVSAAAEYPAVCRTLFRQQRPAAYPPELAMQEAALERLCTVALDIISLLDTTN